MAVSSNVIELVIRGRDQASRAFRTLGRSVSGFKQSLQSISGLAAGFLGGLGLRELGRAADQYTLLGNRLRIVTDSQAELNAVQDELVDIAQSTRSELLSVGELYARVARSTDQLGASQSDVLDFTQAVSQAIQISGATAAEASAGVVQFSQGLASGALRGDELRSVLEQLPRLALAIAENMGITIGELRTLGQEGKLTGEAVFNAVLRAAPELQQEFSKISPTLGQAITTIRNFATVTIGSFNEAAGITQGLVEIFATTGEETRSLAETVRGLGLAFREFVEIATVAVASFVEGRLPLLFNDLKATTLEVIDFLQNPFGIRNQLFSDEEFLPSAVIRAEVDRLAAERPELEQQLELYRSALTEEFDRIAAEIDARRNLLGARDAELGDVSGGLSSGGLEIDEKALAKQAEFIENLRREASELGIQAADIAGAESAVRLYNVALDAAALGNAEFVAQALEAAAAVNTQASALERAEAAAENRELIDALREELSLVKLTDRERAIEIETRKLAAGATQEQIAEVKRLSAAIFDEQAAFSETEDFAKRAAENMQDSLADFFFDPVDDGFEGMVDGFRDAIRRMIAEAAAARLLETLFPDGVNGASGLGGFLKKVFGFEEGGFTGEGSRDEPAGIVHRGEHVMPAKVVKRPGVLPFLEALRKGDLPQFQEGGLVPSFGSVIDSFQPMPREHVAMMNRTDQRDQRIVNVTQHITNRFDVGLESVNEVIDARAPTIAASAQVGMMKALRRPSIA